MLKSFTLSGQTFFYYDMERKVLARFPSKSNLLSKGSDNSLYFGINTNEDLKKLFTKFFSVKNINDIQGLNFDMQCVDEYVNVVININKQGQIQVKIMKDGTMFKVANEYAFSKVKEYDFTKMLVVVDFNKHEIRFKDPEELVL